MEVYGCALWAEYDYSPSVWYVLVVVRYSIDGICHLMEPLQDPTQVQEHSRPAGRVAHSVGWRTKTGHKQSLTVTVPQQVCTFKVLCCCV